MSIPYENFEKEENNFQNIITCIEKSISEIIQECPIRNLKTKVLTLKENTKILFKRLNGYKDLLSIKDEYHKFKNDTHSQFEDYKTQIKTLKEENLNLTSQINSLPSRFKSMINNNIEKSMKLANFIKDNNDEVSQMQMNNEKLNKLLSEEKGKHKKALNHIKNLEETIITLKEEYDLINYNKEKKESLNENFELTVSSQKKTILDLKKKIEELADINKELKQRYFESENLVKNHSNDFKSLIKQNLNYKKIIEELQKEKSKSELEYKELEDKLKVLRYYNSKLENKSQSIVKKYEMIKGFEDKSDQLNLNYGKLLKIIDELNGKILLYENENTELKESNQRISTEIKEIESNLKNSVENFRLLSSEKENLYNRNIELENNLKSFLDNKKNFDNIKPSPEIISLKNKDQLNSKYFRSMNEDKNLRYQTDIESKIEQLNPAKLIYLQNNNVEIKNS